MAAPIAGLPEAAPMAAPSPAPITVPSAAPVAVFAAPVALGVVPVCSSAHCRHTALSAWNCSKFLPVPGSTMTLGPVGTTAHAVRREGPADREDGPARGHGALGGRT